MLFGAEARGRRGSGISWENGFEVCEASAEFPSLRVRQINQDVGCRLISRPGQRGADDSKRHAPRSLGPRIPVQNARIRQQMLRATRATTCPTSRPTSAIRRKVAETLPTPGSARASNCSDRRLIFADSKNAQTRPWEKTTSNSSPPACADQPARSHALRPRYELTIHESTAIIPTYDAFVNKKILSPRKIICFSCFIWLRGVRFGDSVIGKLGDWDAQRRSRRNARNAGQPSRVQGREPVQAERLSQGGARHARPDGGCRNARPRKSPEGTSRHRREHREENRPGGDHRQDRAAGKGDEERPAGHAPDDANFRRRSADGGAGP